ncbi:MAG TPA: MerR family transcriptional regulator [Ktedonobacteraceae bacterium]
MYIDPTPDKQQRVPASPEELTISQAAHLSGINAKAIRYYESIGLLPSPSRSTNSYRRYSMADVNRLILLRRIRYLGVPLAEAKTLLIGATDAQCADVQQELLQIVNIRLVILDQEIAELQHLRDEMQAYQRKLANCHPDEREPFRTCVDLSCIAISEEKR